MPRIDQVMTPDPLWVDATATVASTVRTMLDHGLGTLPVCNAAGRVVGMVSDRAILTAWAAGDRTLHEDPVGPLAEPVPTTVAPQNSAGWALEVMSAYRVRRLPVVDDGRLVGIIALSDLARALPVDDLGRLMFELATA